MTRCRKIETYSPAAASAMGTASQGIQLACEIIDDLPRNTKNYLRYMTGPAGLYHQILTVSWSACVCLGPRLPCTSKGELFLPTTRLGQTMQSHRHAGRGFQGTESPDSARGMHFQRGLGQGVLGHAGKGLCARRLFCRIRADKPGASRPARSDWCKVPDIISPPSSRITEQRCTTEARTGKVASPLPAQRCRRAFSHHSQVPRPCPFTRPNKSA